MQRASSTFPVHAALPLVDVDGPRFRLEGLEAFADFEVGQAGRRAGRRKYAGTREAARFARTARFGLRGRGSPTLSGLLDSQGVVLAGRQWLRTRPPLSWTIARAGSGQTLRRAARHEPVVEPCVCWKRRAVSGRKRSGRPWTREAETGEAVRRLARRGSPRRGRGSAPGVLRDGQVSRTRKAENARFRAGSRQGDVEGATRRRDRSCPQGATSNWLPSPTLHLTTGRFSKSSGPTNGRSTFFMHVSARFPVVASNWCEKYRAVLRDDVDGIDKVALSPRQGDNGTGA